VHAWRALVGHLSFLVDGLSIARVKRLDASQTEQVGNCVRLDLLVQRRVTAESWRQIDFEKPRLDVLVDQDVEAEELEAVRALGGAEHISGIADHVLATDDCLDDAVLNFPEQ